MNKENYIKTLLDKYLDGETTAAEENALRGYFANPGNSIPDEWLPYKALFAYVEEERASAEERRENTSANKRSLRAARRFKTLAISAAAAAAIAVLVITHGHGRFDDYAVIDGKVCTDQQTVNEEAIEALQIVSSDYDDSFGALEMMKN